MKRPLAVVLLPLLADAWFARHLPMHSESTVFSTSSTMDSHPSFVVLVPQSESSQKDHAEEAPAVSRSREEQKEVMECTVACDPTCLVADFSAFF
jgi:hypothetical protein